MSHFGCIFFEITHILEATLLWNKCFSPQNGYDHNNSSKMSWTMSGMLKIIKVDGFVLSWLLFGIVENHKISSKIMEFYFLEFVWTRNFFRHSKCWWRDYAFQVDIWRAWLWDDLTEQQKESFCSAGQEHQQLWRWFISPNYSVSSDKLPSPPDMSAQSKNNFLIS